MTAHDSKTEFALSTFPRTLWIRYLVSLREHPVYTKMGTAATLNFLQEVVATSVTGTDMETGFKKAGGMAAYGALIGGPMGHFLYALMDRIFRGKTGVGTAIGKLLFGNLVIAPIQTAVYLAAMAYIAGANVRTIIQTIKTRLLPLLKITWMVFPTVQIIAIRYIRPELWLPFFNAVSFVFGTYTNVSTKLAIAKKGKGKSA
ncbi:hypothetical protein DFJ77DRAFT_499437 [Powellomyces hirtus]|nr:hypothetical protein DFJ77DRAFT_499437 [Powellomyces hirtus]